MDLQKSKALLDKISALFKNMSNDPRHISSIERDLMKSYVLQFYESLTDIPTVAETIAPTTASPEVSSPVPPAKITLRKPEPPPAPVPVTPVPAPRPEPIEKVQPEPTVVQLPPVVEVAPPPTPLVQEIPQEPKPATLPIHAAPAHKPQHVAEESHARHTKIPEELEELFSLSSAKELSEKLSQLPIADIKRAMGINERISAVNELFGKDSSLFETTLDQLNRLNSFEQAREHLVSTVAIKYDWASKDKRAQAKEFIKLVKRRY